MTATIHDRTVPVDIIVPVFRGFDETVACLESVLSAGNGQAFELVVIDDCTPETVISDYLNALSKSERATLIRNECNLGFVASVNLGMALHPDRDVVLLNSDTEVAGDWLDRLVACSNRSPDIGTVTPFSNNATICSYPFEGWSDGVPGGLGLAGLDRLFAQVNAGRSVDLPTAVGFCMYIRRACLDGVGLFDVERFGRGYGEENDFCMRAEKAGWRHLLAADVFVFHEGGVSFSQERVELQTRAMARLLEAHPDYIDRVCGFLEADSASVFRDAIDIARVESGGGEARHVLTEQKLKHRLLTEGDHWESMTPGLQEAFGTIAALERGLAHAEKLVCDRDNDIAILNAALAKVESLAIERGVALDQTTQSLEHATQSLQVVSQSLNQALAELEYMKSTRTWRLIMKLKKLSGRNES